MFIEKNNEIRGELFKLVDTLNEQQFNQKPDAESWSPKEILDHLVKMEITITKGISEQLINPTSPVAKKKPIQISTIRLIKVTAPDYTIPSPAFKTKEEMKNSLHQARMELLETYTSTTQDILKNKSLKHPIFGQVPLIQWFPFVGIHEKRHLKQLEKTIEKIKGHK
jgi:uncharacterized damage-inducible protein DinB